MKNVKFKSMIVLSIGCLVVYIAACSNQQPFSDANAAAQQSDKPKNATSNTKSSDKLAQAGPNTVTTVLGASVVSQQGGKKPNIVVIWGDDIGRDNLSVFTKGMDDGLQDTQY